ncbi:MAG: RHS repeat-associated core domain-containing protein, partial [Methylococcales bacterium]|nr:RHS repeat-associated core domain-containing protein [Methylococcales bacterium]
MHQKAEQNKYQLHDYIVLLQTLQSLEDYREFCYQLYLLATYEEQIQGNETKQIAYISLGGKTIGTHVEIIDENYNINPSNPNYKQTYNRYFHTDALGSITSITDDKGTVVERRSYAPFGKIRAMDYGVEPIYSIGSTIKESNRAFTGHEQIEELSGLIHMNARVYDSDIGRFLSADTVIQDPHDSQRYNRYSSVRNNPLVFTDPSGHSWFSKNWQTIKNIVIAVVVAILVVYTGGAILMAGTGMATAATAAGAASMGLIVAAGAIAGAVGGLATGLLTGATFEESLGMAASGALYGGISAGVANVIGSAWGSSTAVSAKAGRALAHGVTRAAISKSQGGKWSAGFWSGFASSALGGQIANAGGLGGQTAMAA